VNLEHYFQRIGWQGETTATPDVLAGLLAHHMRAIPFENIDVRLGRPPMLELAALEAKRVGARRGGYCYEHATLLAPVLGALGFRVHTHSARVVIVAPRSEAPRTHMFLTVGDVMLDPGFGGLAPRLPVPLDGTPAGDHRLVRDGADLALEHRAQRLWVSSLEHDLPVDFEMANHYTATHPRSHFTQRLMMRAYIPAARSESGPLRPGPDGQVRISNRDVTVFRGDEVTTSTLADRAELRAVVAAHFGFDMPELERIVVPSVPEWT
jgi:N-hydroxyarylamine O-acetyltransferase